MADRRFHRYHLSPSPQEQRPAADARFQRILCATDFSPAADQAVRYALSFAQEAQASLFLVHVVEGAPAREIRRHDPNVPNLWDGLAEDAWRRLRAAVPMSARDWCQIEEIVQLGQPRSEILRIAEERHAQLIVVGAHGGTALDRMLLGSISHHLVREARCPVLTTRPPSIASQSQAATRVLARAQGS